MQTQLIETTTTDPGKDAKEELTKKSTDFSGCSLTELGVADEKYVRTEIICTDFHNG